MHTGRPDDRADDRTGATGDRRGAAAPPGTNQGAAAGAGGARRSRTTRRVSGARARRRVEERRARRGDKTPTKTFAARLFSAALRPKVRPGEAAKHLSLSLGDPGVRVVGRKHSGPLSLSGFFFHFFLLDGRPEKKES